LVASVLASQTVGVASVLASPQHHTPDKAL